MAKMKPVDQEVAHDLVKDTQKTGRNKGEIDAADASALNRVIAAKLASKGEKGVTPKRIMNIARAVMSDTGADPTKAMQQMKEKIDREKRRR